MDLEERCSFIASSPCGASTDASSAARKSCCVAYQHWMTCAGCAVVSHRPRPRGTMPFRSGVSSGSRSADILSPREVLPSSTRERLTLRSPGAGDGVQHFCGQLLGAEREGDSGGAGFPGDLPGEHPDLDAGVVGGLDQLPFGIELLAAGAGWELPREI